MQTLRTTTGQTLTISYDPVANTVTFGEVAWFPDPIRATAAPVTGRIVRRLGPALRLVRDKPRARAKAA